MTPLVVRAVVRCEHNQRLVVDAQSLQAVEHVADLAIQVGDDGSVVLLNVRPSLRGVLQVRGNRIAVLGAEWRITPTAGMGHCEAKVQEEGPSVPRHRLQPRHRTCMEHVGGVVEPLRVSHTSRPAPCAMVSGQIVVQLGPAAVDGLRIHVVAERLVNLADKLVEALVKRGSQWRGFAEGASGVARTLQHLGQGHDALPRADALPIKAGASEVSTVTAGEERGAAPGA
mmetsp:Transcript_115373/g.333288  ORF Transcript_115373/g.333288 Transcript_115373/m.333288 type:complete len:228 (+) Transcript_115373:2-685(+)